MVKHFAVRVFAYFYRINCLWTYQSDFFLSIGLLLDDKPLIKKGFSLNGVVRRVSIPGR